MQAHLSIIVSLKTSLKAEVPLKKSKKPLLNIRREVKTGSQGPQRENKRTFQTTQWMT